MNSNFTQVQMYTSTNVHRIENFKRLTRLSLVALVFVFSQFNLFSQVPNVDVTKGCGTNGGGWKEMHATFFDIKCPLCCSSDYCAPDGNGYTTCHKCVPVISDCDIVTLDQPGGCPICITIDEISSVPQLYKVSVHSLNRFWHVSQYFVITGVGYEGIRINLEDIIGDIEGEKIDPEGW
jgi:hypothetical protein